MDPKQLFDLIAQRRSVFPKQYNQQPISTKTIMDILAQANWAPTHRLTEPWRFKIMRGTALDRLGDISEELYKKYTPAEKFSAEKQNKKGLKPRQSACVIAICMQRDPQESVPEWEEIAAVSCAVQNMWLACTALKVGAYWSSPGIIEQEEFQSFLDLKKGERCLGLFYMGYYDEVPQEGKRGAMSEKITWMNS